MSRPISQFGGTGGSTGGSMNPAIIGALIGGGTDLLGGLFSSASKRKQAKQQQKAIDKMLAGAPKFDYYKNDLFGYSASPQSDMLNYGMMNSLINTLAPAAGMDFGEGFADMWNQYSPAQYAFGHAPGMGAGVGAAGGRGGGMTAMNPDFQGGGGRGGMQTSPMNYFANNPNMGGQGMANFGNAGMGNPTPQGKSGMDSEMLAQMMMRRQ